MNIKIITEYKDNHIRERLSFFCSAPSLLFFRGFCKPLKPTKKPNRQGEDNCLIPFLGNVVHLL